MLSNQIKRASLINQADSFHPPARSTDVTCSGAESYIFGGSQHLSDSEIPECQGVWANAATLEACREDLQDALEGWIILGLRLGHTLPILDGVDLNFTKEVA
ncbi:MAG: hypothetical protein V7K97_07360 [Nostoc sp.]|uniref:type II toxin-antitoxin system HicB family antitoxin n=1 Tax=Nostoc sp. TaxID=1180 RepID=UPI002FFAD8A3